MEKKKCTKVDEKPIPRKFTFTGQDFEETHKNIKFLKTPSADASKTQCTVIIAMQNKRIIK